MVRFTTTELEAYLDESLPAERMAAIEAELRASDALRQSLIEINGRRDAGVHSLGDIWRRHRLSCPSREQLGSYLLQILDEGCADYVQFHLETIECRRCQANLEDLQAQQAEADTAAVESRRRRYFQSSVGHLRPE
ncbi:MAG: hypothetical protein WD851_13190 [Pirellulales bacterium]